MKKIALTAAAAVVTAGAVLGMGQAHAYVEPRWVDYYYDKLRKDGFTVDGHEQYWLEKGLRICEMERVGWVWMDIADGIANMNGISKHEANKITLDASIWLCPGVA